MVYNGAYKNNILIYIYILLYTVFVSLVIHSGCNEALDSSLQSQRIITRDLRPCRASIKIHENPHPNQPKKSKKNIKSSPQKSSRTQGASGRALDVMSLRDLPSLLRWTAWVVKSSNGNTWNRIWSQKIEDLEKYS